MICFYFFSMDKNCILRCEQPGKNVSNPNYFQPEQHSNFYLDELSRWKGDFIAEEQRRRAERIKLKEEKLSKKREGFDKLEKAKQQREEQSFREEQDRLQNWQKLGRKGKSNKSAANFDIITMEYRTTPEGQRLKQQDDLRRQQAHMRAYRLYERNNTVSHNIITGEPPRPFPDSRMFSPL